MTVKISGTFPKDLLAFNGLELHQPDIVSTELSGDEDEHWTGYAICRLSIKQVAKLADGSFVPTVQIEHIEVMEGERVEPTRRMLLDTFRGRTTDGVIDPVIEEGANFLRHGSGLHTARDLVPEDADPFEADTTERPTDGSDQDGPS